MLFWTTLYIIEANDREEKMSNVDRLNMMSKKNKILSK